MSSLRSDDRVELVGISSPIKALREVICKVAPVDVTVLLTGETGSGKEVVARSIHSQGSRARQPFVAVNCGAIPTTLFESTLFGHRKGAFTDAGAGAEGTFVAADGGTLFLDEIGELPLKLQTKLLRVLQQQVVEPVGAPGGVPIDVRVIAATNRNLRASVAGGQFRRDLYYRLNVVPIDVPPLRRRREDIPVLFEYFLGELNRKYGHHTRMPTPAAHEALTEYAWPGNVRELFHLVERLVILHPDEQIDVTMLPAGPAGWWDATERVGMEEQDGIDLREAVANYERALIREAMERTGGNKNRAAALLKIARTTLIHKLKRHFNEADPVRRHKCRTGK